uniref:Uncharacterized protein n=1 Tax=Zea mays TaxID=4577 RepID=A0A804LLP5_MAIZE
MFIFLPTLLPWCRRREQFPGRAPFQQGRPGPDGPCGELLPPSWTPAELPFRSPLLPANLPNREPFPLRAGSPRPDLGVLHVHGAAAAWVSHMDAPLQLAPLCPWPKSPVEAPHGAQKFRQQHPLPCCYTPLSIL